MTRNRIFEIVKKMIVVFTKTRQRNWYVSHTKFFYYVLVS